jgi:general stress protein 26
MEQVNVLMSEDTKKMIGDLIDKQDISVISSIGSDGFPYTRTVSRRKREGLKVFYFSTNLSSVKVSHYRKNPKACIYFFDVSVFKTVMFTGTMEILEDDASKKMLWDEHDLMFYPEGVNDPDYCVLRFTARTGRLYSKLKMQNFDIE